jgi:fatty acid desaturase
MPKSAVEGEQPLYEEGKSDGSIDKATRKALFQGIKTKYEWPVYNAGFIQMGIYTAIYVASWLQLRAGASLLYCLPFAWAKYCLWMVGHEAYHHTMAPSKTVNAVVGWIMMDCNVVTKKQWIIEHHHIHHRHPWSKADPEDRQRLFGPNVLIETLQVIKTVLTVWMHDFQDLVTEFHPLNLIAMIIRFAQLLLLPFNAVVGATLALGMIANYAALLAHAIPVFSKTSDGIRKQLRTSVDIFPESNIAVFLSGALNDHAVHHVVPALPRSMHPSFSKKLRTLLPNEYRVVDDWAGLWALWTLRHQEYDHDVSMKDLPRLASEYNWQWQLIQDTGATVFFAYMTTLLPQIWVM